MQPPLATAKLLAPRDLSSHRAHRPGLRLFELVVHARARVLLLATHRYPPTKYAQLPQPFLPVLLIRVSAGDQLEYIATHFLRIQSLQEFTDALMRFGESNRTHDLRCVLLIASKEVLLP